MINEMKQENNKIFPLVSFKLSLKFYAKIYNSYCKDDLRILDSKGILNRTFNSDQFTSEITCNLQFD